MYAILLGDTFRYKIGIQGAMFDLFLWNVLMNRREMSELFLYKCNFPVRCAITAVNLLRKMSQVCCSVLQRVAACCSVLQRVAM